MTDDQARDRRRDKLLREARRRLTRLEIEAHQINARLASVETAAVGVPVMDAAVDLAARPARSISDTQPMERRLPSTSLPAPTVAGQTRPKTRAQPGFVVPPSGPAVPRQLSTGAPADKPVARPGCRATGLHRVDDDRRRRISPRRPGSRPASVPVVVSRRAARAATDRRSAWRDRLSDRLHLMPSWLVSLAVHVVLLTLLGLVTMATLPDKEPTLEASILEPDNAVLQYVSKVKIEPIVLDEPVPQAAAMETQLPTPSEMDVGQLDLGPAPPARSQAKVPSPRPTGGVGQPGPNGRGGQGRGRGRGGRGSITNFFGTRAQAKRIVFLVDNSNSMRDGRFETALLELSRSVQQMSPRQSFYVIFYSDTVYRMFHPDPAPELVPATRQNKQRLLAWLRTTQMCQGGKLVDAVQAARRLEPQVIYLLSDGVLGDYPVQYLTEPTDPRIVIHTIGMTVPNMDAARRLQTIAQANRGTFRPVGVNLLARRMARQRPIARNRFRGPVWGIRLPAK